jgi:hypothetical protein
MGTRQKILLYGSSLVLAGMQAGLKESPLFDVIAIGQPAAREDLSAVDPSVIIFDLGAFQEETILEQVQARPGLLLIGIDAESHRVLLTGQGASSISLDQISLIVRSRG